ncbi:unnamed protein product [Darwinula stevensoni]|uniref:Uncharacterized protein n=1 Tax=Darwinula stevensoni TaxID=69355 RepID=A0A7R9A5E3_9CRUS|nr:unnamed protein product [Darwinula stevensoni]CAG0891848.1 unnamed protein product [Darwinula stevensoni]
MTNFEACFCPCIRRFLAPLYVSPCLETNTTEFHFLTERDFEILVNEPTKCIVKGDSETQINLMKEKVRNITTVWFSRRRKTQPERILVVHPSEKATKQLRDAVPRWIEASAIGACSTWTNRSPDERKEWVRGIIQRSLTFCALSPADINNEHTQDEGSSAEAPAGDINSVETEEPFIRVPSIARGESNIKYKDGSHQPSQKELLSREELLKITGLVESLMYILLHSYLYGISSCFYGNTYTENEVGAKGMRDSKDYEEDDLAGKGSVKEEKSLNSDASTLDPMHSHVQFSDENASETEQAQEKPHRGEDTLEIRQLLKNLEDIDKFRDAVEADIIDPLADTDNIGEVEINEKSGHKGENPGGTAMADDDYVKTDEPLVHGISNIDLKDHNRAHTDEPGGPDMLSQKESSPGEESQQLRKEKKKRVLSYISLEEMGLLSRIITTVFVGCGDDSKGGINTDENLHIIEDSVDTDRNIRREDLPGKVEDSAIRSMDAHAFEPRNEPEDRLLSSEELERKESLESRQQKRLLTALMRVVSCPSRGNIASGDADKIKKVNKLGVPRLQALQRGGKLFDHVFVLGVNDLCQHYNEVWFRDLQDLHMGYTDGYFWLFSLENEFPEQFLEEFNTSYPAKVVSTMSRNEPARESKWIYQAERFIKKTYNDWETGSTTRLVPPVQHEEDWVKAAKTSGGKSERHLILRLYGLGRKNQMPMFITYNRNFSHLVERRNVGGGIENILEGGEHDIVLIHREIGVIFVQVKNVDSRRKLNDNFDKAKTQLEKDFCNFETTWNDFKESDAKDMTVSLCVVALTNVKRAQVERKSLSDLPVRSVFLCEEDLESLESIERWWNGHVLHHLQGSTIDSRSYLRLLAM